MIQHAQAADSRPVICQVLHSLHVGGAELLAVDLARKLNDQFRFVFACLDGMGQSGEQIRSEGFEVAVLHRQPGIDWRCGLRLSQFLKEQNARLVHAHQYTPFFQSLLARGLSRRLPIVFTEHGRQYPDYRRPKRVVCNRVLVQKRDRLIAVGESVRQALIDFEGLTASRVEVIRNGVGLDDYLKAGADERLRCQVRSELNLQDGEFTVLQVARLNELKDHATAVRTIAHLRDQGLRARLLLAGDGEERAAIEQRVMELNLRDQVTLLGTRRDVPRLLAACDAFLLTSISEGIPLTLIEAMAASRPVVSTKVGGVGEIVVPGETGFLAPAGDPVWLARHLAELRSRPERRHAFGEAGRQRAIAEFDQQKMLDAYAGVYSQALSDCRSARSANGHSSERPPMEPVA